MKCPFQVGTLCIYVDISIENSKKSCEKCELYNNGERPTGCYKQTTVLATAIILILLYLIL